MDNFHEGKYLGKEHVYDVINRLGYKVGNVYNCKIFVKDLEDELQCGVKVTFEDHPSGIRSKIKRIREVLILSDKDAENPITGLPSDESSVFVLEDLSGKVTVGDA